MLLKTHDSPNTTALEDLIAFCKDGQRHKILVASGPLI
uniref:Uncharacterized protein n=1 Tax=Arundo donax TaxID=35708 RepID=A0A0A9E337_ARUDO